jgi:cation-transporting ATPase E
MIELLPMRQPEQNQPQSAVEVPIIGQTAAPTRGLSEREALDRRASGQGNTAPAPSSRTYRQIVVENVFTFINSCLFCLGIGLALLGRPLDALISTGVIALNILVSVVQEIRAKRTLDRIALLTRPTATVIRDGQAYALPPEQLVVGDLLTVGPGDQIVVDGTVVGDGRMQVDESQLTGESHPVPKRAGDQVFSGSFCVSGAGTYAAERVGAQSLAGQITAGARAFRRVLTPLQQQVHLVIRIMLLIVVYFEFLLVVNALLKEINLAESVQSSTIVAGLVPNGLFLSISVAYALAAVRIIRFGALIQQANAVESLSNVDVLCLDKTGTLTANRLQVSSVHPFGMAAADLQRILSVMAASARTGTPSSAAIAAAYPSQPARLVAEVPFASARKWSAVAFTTTDDRRPTTVEPQMTGDSRPSVVGGRWSSGIFALGAPEFLRPSIGASEGEWQAIADQAHSLTSQGLRVLLVAHHADPTLLEDQADDSRLPTGMTPLGLVSLRDELRPEAQATLAAFIAAGVQPKIISGDSPETVAALARQAGLGPDIRLISGLELAHMDEAQFAAAAAAGTIFGRITPQQKEQLVRSLRQQGHYVAMIGDGVNDVLSLKQANLGIAMQSGSQATRGVADIVLMQDSFAALAPAVEEGQRISNGMYDILKLFLTRIGTVGLLILSSLVLGEFPLALRQGSLLNLLSVGIPTILLALWARPGPAPKGGLFKQIVQFVVTPVLITSAIALVLFSGTFMLLLQRAGALDPALAQAQYITLFQAVRPVAQTALTAFLVVCGLFLVIFVEPPTEWWSGGDTLSGDWKPTILAVLLMAAFVVINAVPQVRALFALAPLGWIELSLVAGATAIWLPLVRMFWRKRLIARFLGLHRS